MPGCLLDLSLPGQHGTLSRTQTGIRCLAIAALLLALMALLPPSLTVSSCSSIFLFLLAMESIVVYHIVMRQKKKEEAEVRMCASTGLNWAGS